MTCLCITNYVEGSARAIPPQAPRTTAAKTFAPYVSKQHELGVKYEHPRSSRAWRCSRSKSPAASWGANDVYSVQSEQRNRGVEVSLYGEVAPGTRLMGGVTFLDGELTKSATAANRGNKQRSAYPTSRPTSANGIPHGWKALP